MNSVPTSSPSPVPEFYDFYDNSSTAPTLWSPPGYDSYSDENEYGSAYYMYLTTSLAFILFVSGVRYLGAEYGNTMLLTIALLADSACVFICSISTLCYVAFLSGILGNVEGRVLLSVSFSVILTLLFLFVCIAEMQLTIKQRASVVVLTQPPAVFTTMPQDHIPIATIINGDLEQQK